MATLAFFHAHPDDECIATAGTMCRAAEEGHRVVLITATRGEHGEVPDGYLDPGEALVDRRVRELAEAASILGVADGDQRFLGYVDSGMMGTPENDAPHSFWQADLDEAAERLAAILADVTADVLTVYDDHGGYGHPDHINVHRVGVRAAELAGVERVYESTFDRDYFRQLMERAEEFGLERPDQAAGPDGETGAAGDGDAAAAGGGGDGPPDPESFGSPGHLITTRVDVRPWLDRKRKAMQAHGSQISETSFFLAMPPEAFEASFGTEFYIHRGAPAGTAETWLL